MAVAAADFEEGAPGLAAQRDTRAMVGIWVFVISDAVGFSALLSTMMALGGGQRPGLPPSVWASILLLALTSLALVFAARHASRRRLLIATLLAVAFVAVQVVAHASILRDGFLFVEPAGERRVVVVLFHLLHALVGAVLLARTLLPGRVSLAPISLYWHYLGLVYLVIIGLFYSL